MRCGGFSLNEIYLYLTIISDFLTLSSVLSGEVLGYDSA